MATFAFKAVDLAGMPQAGTLDGVSRQAVTEELKGRGLRVMALEEKKSGLQMEIRLTPEAAEETSERLNTGAMKARGQLYFADPPKD